MELANQTQIDDFLKKHCWDEEIYPYLSIDKWVSEKKEYRDDWGGGIYVSKNNDCLFHYAFNRSGQLIMDISIYSKSSKETYKCFNLIKNIIKRYGVEYLESCSHESNKKSLKIQNKIYGNHCGIKKDRAWNSLKGKYEDLYQFRIKASNLKLLQNENL